MLNMNVRDNLHPLLKQLLTDFRRVQVSRYPIEVTQHNDDDVHAVKFVDSRFPTDSWRRERVLAYMATQGVDDKGRPKLTLYGRLIENAKYSNTSDEYHQKVTTDPKKMASWLREYVKPYSQQEIMNRAIQASSVQYDYDQWRAQPRVQFRDIVHHMTADDVAEEIMYLKSVGVQFRSQKFQDVATQGLELYAEAKRRLHAPKQHAHVFIQPDGAVLVTAKDIPNFKGFELQFESFEQMPEAIQQQVAMLRMCERGQYVTEVGRMNSDTDFWVHVNPSDLNIQNT